MAIVLWYIVFRRQQLLSPAIDFAHLCQIPITLLYRNTTIAAGQPGDHNNHYNITNICKDFRCSEFLSFRGEIEPTIVCDLDNEINPVFVPQNLSDEAYAKAAPAFRLALKALLTDAAMKYLPTMADGDMYKATYNDKGLCKGDKITWQQVDEIEQQPPVVAPNGERSIWFVRILKYPSSTHPRSVNDEMRERARVLIANMASMIDTEFTDFDGEDDAPNGRSSAFEGPLPAHLHQHFRRGFRSINQINFKMLQDLEDVSQPEYHQLKLAATLVHEFAHAFQKAVNGKRREEVLLQELAHCRGWLRLRQRDLRRHRQSKQRLVRNLWPEVDEEEEFTTTFQDEWRTCHQDSSPTGMALPNHRRVLRRMWSQNWPSLRLECRCGARQRTHVLVHAERVHKFLLACR